jgi:ubiquinone/menaquinone biosynthesis C-methylase UbiE
MSPSSPPRSVPSASSAPGTAPDFTAIRRRQQTVWASGDFAVVGVTLQIVGELLAESVDVRAGERVLDVAAGNGNATLAAARRFAEVTSTDYVPHLLDKGAARARAEGLAVEFEVADAVALPFPDARFDVAVSTFGVMFCPQQDRCARELVRVVRPGGRIGLASWTPQGFLGQLFAVMGRHVPPTPGVESPLLWGSEARITELFSAHAAAIHCVLRQFTFRYRSPAHWIEVFRAYYGPTHQAYAALDAAGQAALTRDLEALLGRCNRAGPDSLVVPAEYLEVVVTTR